MEWTRETEEKCYNPECKSRTNQWLKLTSGYFSIKAPVCDMCRRDNLIGLNIGPKTGMKFNKIAHVDNNFAQLNAFGKNWAEGR